MAVLEKVSDVDKAYQEAVVAHQEIRQFYNAAIDARINFGFHASKLKFYRKVAFVFNLVTALSAVSVATILPWKLAIEGIAVAFAVVAALSSAVRPLLKLEEKIEKYGGLRTANKALFLSFDQMIDEARLETNIDPCLWRRFSDASARLKYLEEDDVDVARGARDQEKIHSLQAKAEKYYEIEKAWLPETSARFRAEELKGRLESGKG